MTVQKIILPFDPNLPSLKSLKQIGTPLHEKDFTIRITSDTDLYYCLDPEGKKKKLLFAYRQRVIPKALEWFSILHSCFDTPLLTTDRRFRAAGESSKKRVLVPSGVIGFYDRLTPRHKVQLKGVNIAGRTTAFTRHFPDRWRVCLPFFNIVSNIYRDTVPSFYRRQLQFYRTIAPALRIPNTIFTTVTVNRNWVTHTHTDTGDYPDGLSCLVILGHGFTGGFLGFPLRKILIETCPGDILFMDSHEPHGNTPLSRQPDGQRLSLVCYIRTDLALFHRKTTISTGEIFYLP